MFRIRNRIPDTERLEQQLDCITEMKVARYTLSKETMVELFILSQHRPGAYRIPCEIIKKSASFEKDLVRNFDESQGESQVALEHYYQTMYQIASIDSRRYFAKKDLIEGEDNGRLSFMGEKVRQYYIIKGGFKDKPGFPMWLYGEPVPQGAWEALPRPGFFARLFR